MSWDWFLIRTRRECSQECIQGGDKSQEMFTEKSISSKLCEERQVTFAVELALTDVQQHQKKKID